MFHPVRSRALLLVVLLGVLFGLCVWFGSLGVDPSVGAFPSDDEVAADYDRYVGERVAVGGTVVSVEPIEIVVRNGGTSELHLTVTGATPDSVREGDVLRVFGVAEADRTVRASNAIVTSPGGYWYSWTVSFLAGLWVLGRILTQWRVGALGLVPRRWPISLWDRLGALVGREEADA